MTRAAGLAGGMLLSGGKPGKLLGGVAKLGALAAVGGVDREEHKAGGGRASAPLRKNLLALLVDDLAALAESDGHQVFTV